MPIPVIPGTGTAIIGPINIGVWITGTVGPYDPLIAAPQPGRVEIGVAIPGPAYNPIPLTPPEPIPEPDPETGIIPNQPPPAPVMYPAGYADTFACSLQRAVNDVGSGSASFWSSAPANGDNVAIVVGGSVRQTFTVESREARTIDQNEETGEYVTCAGPGHAVALSRVRVLPDLGGEEPERMGAPAQKARFFDWTASTGIDRSGWPAPVVTDPKYGGTPGTPNAQRFTRPEGWPYDGAKWIATRSSVSNHPVGDYYLYCVTRIPSGTYNVFVGANDEHETWIDGVSVCARSGFYTGQMEKASIEISGNHFHYITARVTNRGGRSGYTLAIMPVDDTRTNGTPVVQSGVTGWKVMMPAPSSPPPGMTAGKILHIIRKEAQARGAWPSGWVLGFGEENDSNGSPWPVLHGYSLEVGTDLLTALGQLGETDFDWVALPGGTVIQAYRGGNLPGGTAVLGSLSSSVTTVDSSRVIDSLLAQYDGPDGHVYVGSGGREGYVSLSGVKDRDEAIRLANALLDVQSQPRTTYQPSPAPFGEGGGNDFGFDIGDSAGGGQIRQLSVVMDDEGKVTATPGITDPLDVKEAQINRTLAKYASGAMDGNLAAGVSDPAKPASTGTGTEYPIPSMGVHGLLSSVLEPLGPYAPERPCIINRFFGTLRNGGLGPSVIHLLINGDEASSTTIATGATYFSHVMGPGGILIKPGDLLSYRITTAGAFAAGLTINTNASVA